MYVIWLVAGAFDDTMSILATLSLIALGSGGAGIVGSWLSYRKFRLEQKQAETSGTVALREVDVEQFKALFPGGLGDAVEHWREEAKDLYKQVDELQDERGELRGKLRAAERRIETLEAENAELKKGQGP